MIKGAFIFAFGAGSGLVVGVITGITIGFKASEAIKTLAAMGEKEQEDEPYKPTEHATVVTGYLEDEE